MKSHRVLVALLALCAGVVVWQQMKLRKLEARMACDAPVAEEGAPEVWPMVPTNALPPTPRNDVQQRTGRRPDVYTHRMDVKSIRAGRSCFEIKFYGSHAADLPTFASLQKALRVEPAVANFVARPDANGWCYALEGDFVPEETYTLVIRKDPGLETSEGQRIEQTEDWVYVVKAPLPKASVRLDMAGRYFVPKGKLLMGVDSLATKTYTLTVERLAAHNVVNMARLEDRQYWNGPEGWTRDLTAATTSLTYTVSAPLNEVCRQHVSLRDFTGDATRGVFLVTAQVPREESDWWTWTDARLSAVTDIGLSAVFGEGEVSVCALSLSEALPLAGLEVELFALNGSSLARGKTGADGAAHLTFAKAAQPTDEPLVVVATGAEDQSFLLVNAKNEVDVPVLSSHRYLKEKALEAYVFTERGIYRPGDAALVQGLVRGRDGLPPKETFPLFVTLTGPGDHAYKPHSVMCDATGSFSLELALPETGRQGRYEISVAHAPKDAEAMGWTSVNMESFVPPTVRMTLGDMAWKDAETLEIPRGCGLSFWCARARAAVERAPAGKRLAVCAGAVKGVCVWQRDGCGAEVAGGEVGQPPA